ncbi:MAG: hypothetical protein QOE90_2320 [Thermoplasmata archaeon]|jgi:hypothetical protein|nr:hypothetical protein [Thermoplasmata archaeon]
METVDLGGVRLHVLPVWPGLPGEGDRVAREMGALDPAVVLMDLDTDDALRLREAVGAAKPAFVPSFVDQLFHDEVVARYAKDALPGEHPVLVAARVARNRGAVTIPLRATAPKPGFFDRRRARKAAASVAPVDIKSFGPAFADALAKADVWRAQEDADAAWGRLTRALTDGRAPLLCLVQAHRAAPLLSHLQNTRRVAP